MATSRDQDLLGLVREHLRQMQNNVELPLNQTLLEEAEVFLPPQLASDSPDRNQVVSQISILLPQLRQDPTVLIRLLMKLIEPFSFSEILAMQPPVDLVAGLSLSAQPYNRLTVRLIEKAAGSAADLAHLANMPEVVKAFVHLWLRTLDMGVADSATATLHKLLEVDQEPTSVAVHGVGDGSSNKASGQGLIWRRLFGDKDVYGLILSVCGTPVNGKPVVGTKERSLAQARLMALAPKLGQLDWTYLVRSHHPDVEHEYGLETPREGLLDFIAIHMVDWKRDVLIHINLIQFFADLLTHVREPSSQKYVSVSLSYLQQSGLHDRTLSFWMKPEDPSHDPVDVTFLYGPAAQYLSVYASNYPNAFLQDSSVRRVDAGVHSVLDRLSRALSISANQWAQGQSPKHDISLLMSLPRVSLLPQAQLGAGRQRSPLFLVPCKSTSPEALQLLAAVFHGPTQPGDVRATNSEQGSETEQQESVSEAAAARALYALYLSYHESMFGDLVQHATTIALPEKAIAALNLISAIATARWSPLPSENAFEETAPPTLIDCLPSESKLQSLLPTSYNASARVAETGIEALLQSPAREKVIPFLLRPPQTFSNLVGGRGDPESSAYRVAMAKWDCTLLVQKRLREVNQAGRNDADFLSLVRALDARAREGPWGATSEAGGRIASLEL